MAATARCGYTRFLAVLAVLLVIASPGAARSVTAEAPVISMDLDDVPEASLIYTSCPGPDHGTDACVESDDLLDPQYNHSEIFELTAGSHEPRRVTHNDLKEIDAVFSPSKKRAVVRVGSPRHRARCSLYIVKLASGDTRQLLRQQGGCPRPTHWSPNGKWILYETEWDSDWVHGNLYKIRPSGRDRTRLTNFGWTSYPSYSSWVQGDIIFARTNQDGPSGIIRINRRGGERRRLVRGLIQGMSVSPDGSRVAYVRRRAKERQQDLFLMNSDGSNKRAVTHTPGDENYPTWSPDGRKLVFTTHRRNRQSRARVFRIRSKTFVDVALPAHIQGPLRFAWSPSGKYIAYRAHDQGNAGYATFATRVGSSRVMRLTQTSYQHRLFGWIDRG